MPRNTQSWTLPVVLFLSLLLSISAKAESNCTCGPECYGANFADGEKYVWARILAEKTRLPRASGSGGVLSRPSWLIDTNHADYALFVGPLVIWSEPYMLRYPDTIAQGHGIPGCPDLRGATLKLQLKVDYKPPRGEYDIRRGGRPSPRLLFWVQTALSDRIVNYAYNLNLLDREEVRQEREYSLVLDDPHKWICLGGNRMFAGETKYGCVSREQDLQAALSAVNVDMGFILVLPDYEAGSGKRLSWLNSVAPLRTPWADGTDSYFRLTNFTIERAAK